MRYSTFKIVSGKFLHSSSFKKLIAIMVALGCMPSKQLNAKIEIKISKQIRKTKVEKRNIQTGFLRSTFEIQIAFLFRLSDFGFVSKF